MLKALVDFPGGSLVKNLPAMQKLQEMQFQSLGQEDPLEEDMATHSKNLVWKIPWTEEPGGLLSTGLQRVKHDLAHMHADMKTLVSSTFQAIGDIKITEI